MTDQEKIKELSLYHHMQCDWFEEALGQMSEWKNKQIKKDIHQFCRFCESKLIQDKKHIGCAFRCLGNEYCDFIDDMLKKYK